MLKFNPNFTATRLISYCGIMMLLITLSKVTNAGQQDTHEQIRTAVESALAQQTQGADNVSFRVGHLDPRLRLQYCDQPLEINDNMPIDLHRSRINVKVACRGSSPWRIYVPLEVSRSREAVVLTSDLQRGDRIGRSDVSVSTIDANQIHGQVFTDPEVVVGHVLTRAMRAGEVVTDRMVDTNRVIRRGDRVQIKAGSGGVTVMALGEAQEHGGIGDRISVKNTRSGQTVQAIVEDARSVRAIGRF